MIKSVELKDLPKLKAKTIDFAQVRSFQTNLDANCVMFRSKDGKEFTRLSVEHASPGFGPEITLKEKERVIGIYGSFDERHKFIKSLGLIVWTPS
jgi:hypothetical protein